jgi:DHA1 family bicyclomycin/chloramphenicol resistance-like MFS transporter
MATLAICLLLVALLRFKETNPAPDPQALRPGRLLQSLGRIFGNHQSRYFLVVATATQFAIISFVSNAPRFFKSAFGIEGLDFALLFAATGLGIVVGQIANNRVIARAGVLATTRLAAGALAAVAGIIVLLSLMGALPGVLFTGLMLLFNTSLLVVMANTASLVIDPHREIAGFASSAYGFFTQITGSTAAALTLPLFNGALLPWAISMLCVMSAVLMALLAYRPRHDGLHGRGSA